MIKIIKTTENDESIQKTIDFCTSNSIQYELITSNNCKYEVKSQSEKKDINDLINLVEILRGENGCPWDKEQTHESIKNSIIEESYEVLDAIEKNDYKSMQEELGDVLFQVIFHASIEGAHGKFKLEDIITGIYDKMVFRHPHVFGSEKAYTSDDVLMNWDDIKRKEKKMNTYTDELLGVAKALPSLIRTSKILNKINKAGFDMQKADIQYKKIKQELLEIIRENNLEGKMGLLFLCCVDISRGLNINSEEALSNSIDELINRFNVLEKEVMLQNKNINELTNDEMNKIWENTKKLEK